MSLYFTLFTKKKKRILLSSIGRLHVYNKMNFPLGMKKSNSDSDIQKNKYK